jgi:hypothetical protein
LGILSSHIQLSFKVVIPKVRDMVPCVLLISTTDIYFRTPDFRTSGILASHIQLSSKVVIPEVRDLVSTCPFISMNEIYFGTTGFGTSGILASHIHLSYEVVIPEVRDLASTCPFDLDCHEIYFGTLGIGRSEMHNTTNLPECHICRHVSTSINGPDELRASGLWNFSLHTSKHFMKRLNLKYKISYRVSF